MLDPWHAVDDSRTLVQSFKCPRIYKKSPRKRENSMLETSAAGVLKLNMDGAIFDKLQKVGVEVILRDEKGNVVMAMSKIEHKVDEANDIEALAA